MTFSSISWLAVGLWFAGTVKAQATTDRPSTVHIPTRLEVVVRLAFEATQPLGIALGLDRALCEPAPARVSDISASGLENAVQDIVGGTGYSLDTRDGVYVLTAPDLTAHARRVLSFMVDQWSGRGTVGNLVAFLNGYIFAGTEGAQGFAFSLGSNPDETRITVPEQHDRTIEQIANTVVRLGRRELGCWRPIRIFLRVRLGVSFWKGMHMRTLLKWMNSSSEDA